MLKKLIAGAVLCSWAAPTLAQDADPSAAKPHQSGDASTAVKPEGTTGADGGGTPEPARPKLWFQVEVSPDITSQEPFTPDSTNDSTTVKWTLGLDYNLSPGLSLAVSGGPNATVDSDNDASASSRFVAAASLTAGPFAGFKPFIKYNIALRFTDFFEGRDGTEHTFETGFNFQHKFRIGSFDAGLIARRFESTLPQSDYGSVRTTPKLTFLAFPEVADLIVGAEFERRWYDYTDASVGRERRDWIVQGFVGLDLKHMVNRYLNRGLARQSAAEFRDFSVGVRFVDIQSNVDAQNRSTIRVTPSVSFRVTF